MSTVIPLPSLSPSRVHGHEAHELTWVCEGSVVIEIGHSRWRLTTEQALWIPAGIEHLVIPQQGSLVFPLFFDAVAPPALAQEPTAIHRTPLLNRLAQIKLQPGLIAPADIREAESSMLSLLPALAQTSVRLPMPVDPRALEVAESLLARPATPFTLEQWAAQVHTSSKTLQRCFLNETSMRFPEWRSAARLSAALPLLAEGMPVMHVSAQVGYASVSGFIAAFHRRFGHTPARHRASA
ncbi:helix-turn-helix transcriptional regulator [Mycetocola spongiae]|uniref:helix-turn-helix transcriptional regulator n=1 Tax=Mycetocola spongiae TaxID=2859226 RepID=UPI001CF2AA18|nr:AraC family transcriptional regulator [Mycetocola spongiae]UCR89899.1 AraC family transcriptional regulator [Mycetocola spongiae]